MRVRKANNNCKRVRRVAIRKAKLARIRARNLAIITAQEERWLAALPAMRSYFEESGALEAAGLLSPLPIERRSYGVDLARPGSDRTVVAFGGGLGSGKSWVVDWLRERMARGVVELPETQSFFDELAEHGSAARMVYRDGSPIKMLSRVDFFAVYPATDDGDA